MNNDSNGCKQLLGNPGPGGSTDSKAPPLSALPHRLGLKLWNSSLVQAVGQFTRYTFKLSTGMLWVYHSTCCCGGGCCCTALRHASSAALNSFTSCCGCGDNKQPQAFSHNIYSHLRPWGCGCSPAVKDGEMSINAY